VIPGNVVTDTNATGIEINSSHGFRSGRVTYYPRRKASDHDDNGGVGIVGALLMYDSFGSTVPSNGVTITGNSIYDNGGLGIDLVGYDAANTPGTVGDDDLQYAVVGCNTFLLAPINANDCLAAPVLRR
jgi:hypothetical protein